MADYFYRAFEERFYAPREVIKQLRRQYLPFVLPLANCYPGAPTFDVGCGRGEWLELMAEVGFRPFGVDLDEGMLSACVELGLPAQEGDAVAFLKSLGTETQALITAFHVVEHLRFSQLRVVVEEAIRVLKPGGLLIMETPNPENVVVATNNFYLDPTHQRPLPPQLLEFLTQYAGFERTKILRLQEPAGLSSMQQTLSLWDVFSGASPDFAVVAQKKQASDLTSKDYDSVFERDFGLDLKTLAVRYEQGLAGRLADIAAGTAKLEIFEQENGRLSEGIKRLGQELEKARLWMDAQAAEIGRLSERVTVQESEGKQQLVVIGERLAQRDAELAAVYRSRSWLLTKPLRAISAFLKALRGGSR